MIVKNTSTKTNTFANYPGFRLACVRKLNSIESEAHNNLSVFLRQVLNQNGTIRRVLAVSWSGSSLGYKRRSTGLVTFCGVVPYDIFRFLDYPLFVKHNTLRQSGKNDKSRTQRTRIILLSHILPDCVIKSPQSNRMWHKELRTTFCQIVLHKMQIKRIRGVFSFQYF